MDLGDQKGGASEMQQVKRNAGGFCWAGISKLAMAAVVLAGWLPLRTPAQQPGQKTFASAQQASQALVTAARNNDEKALVEILGPDAKQIVSSGDPTEDAQDRAQFVERYEQMHRLVKEPDGSTTLYIGAENWPLPIPLVNKGSSWFFGTATAKKEILYRRVGRNEMSTIRVCKQLVAAEREYYSSHQEYAQKIRSDPGQQDGLYWAAAQNQPQSPIGPLVAAAVVGASASASPSPFRGYFYHILTGQGPSAPGGAKSYVVDGKMTGGFAFVAYPAEYRSSGVMTFLVAKDGVVYRKDLGPNTATLAKAMKVYDPDATWKQDEDQRSESAAGQTP
jgi:Protein of unknown function (DUF2950)